MVEAVAEVDLVVVTEEDEVVDGVDSVEIEEDEEEDEVVDEEDSLTEEVVEVDHQEVVSSLLPIIITHLTPRPRRWTRSTPRRWRTRWKARTRRTRTWSRYSRTPQARRCLHCQGQGTLACYPKHDPWSLCLW